MTITEDNLEIILDNCTEMFRDGILYMDYLGDYMLNANLDTNDDFSVHLFGDNGEITLTDDQKNKVYLKATHLLNDETEEQKEFNSNKDEHLNY